MSLTISIVLFIAASGFGTVVTKMVGLVYENVSATSVAQYIDSASYSDDGELLPDSYNPISRDEAEDITAALRTYPDADVFGMGSDQLYGGDGEGGVLWLPQAALSKELIADIGQLHPDEPTYALSVTLITMDAEHYAEACEKAGVPLGSNILYNYQRSTDMSTGKISEYAPYNFNELSRDTLHLVSRLDGTPLELQIDGQLTGNDAPKGISYVTPAWLAVIVPNLDATIYAWFADVPDSAGFTAFAKETLKSVARQTTEEIEQNGADVYISALDVAAANAGGRNFVRLMMLFIYGFVAMLTLIALTNVISAISANIQSRSREFAVLESVGMTKGGLRKMIILESVLCSIRSLVWGLPLGVAASYAVYRGAMMSLQFPFEAPWLAALWCIAAVFVITFVTFLYSAGRLRRGSIINAIRGGDGI
ncbi:MAG: ABC transporter permease [Peptococcaceae bacterium]|nr:ABC transporter permease [Peptococcaceae bacterium]